MKNKVLTYKEYIGSIEVDLDEYILYGQILFIRDLITYEANNPSNLKKEFQIAVDDYIETCHSLGREPQKPYKGSFNIRIGQDLHREAAIQAYLEGESLNNFIKLSLEEKVHKQPQIQRHVHEHIIKHTVIEKTTEETEITFPSPEPAWVSVN